jgi:hypothetical protein
MIWRCDRRGDIAKSDLWFESQIIFMSPLCYSRNILEYILGSDRMTDLPLNLIVQTSFEIALDPDHII